MRLLDGITDFMDMSFSKLQRVGDGQGGLLCCSPCGGKELDTTEWLNCTELEPGNRIRSSRVLPNLWPMNSGTSVSAA